MYITSISYMYNLLTHEICLCTKTRFFKIRIQQQQPYPVYPTNSKATYRVWGGWDVDRPCLYPQG
ncbi:hypothetical protein Hanom_Chr15g01339631 [Helianthus anomalus]